MHNSQKQTKKTKRKELKRDRAGPALGTSQLHSPWQDWWLLTEIHTPLPNQGKAKGCWTLGSEALLRMKASVRNASVSDSWVREAQRDSLYQKKPPACQHKCSRGDWWRLQRACGSCWLAPALRWEQGPCPESPAPRARRAEGCGCHSVYLQEWTKIPNSSAVLVCLFFPS